VGWGLSSMGSVFCGLMQRKRAGPIVCRKPSRWNTKPALPLHRAAGNDLTSIHGTSH